ncbi:MAG: hypothetical protein AB1442_06295 [Nitrospirota bacterium]
MLIKNEDIKEVVAEIPAGHRHMRMTIRLQDGQELTFLEASIANIVRAYITVKTHPVKAQIRLVGRKIERVKDGYAEWQLIETDY